MPPPQQADIGYWPTTQSTDAIVRTLRHGRALFAGPLLAWMSGCGWVDAPGTPIEEAHRAAAGYWPENSASAVEGSIEAGFHSIEIDLFLSQDRVPMLNHDGWLDPERCTNAQGDSLEDRVFLVQHTADELQENYRCGGLANPHHPDAETVAEPIMRLSDFMERLTVCEETMVHLDLKFIQGASHSPDVLAAEVLERWWAEDLPNPMVVSSASVDVIRALESRADSVHTVLTWPEVHPDANRTLAGLGHEVARALTIEDVQATVNRAQADGVQFPWELADRRTVNALSEAGFDVRIFTVNSERQKQQFNRWPISAIITDLPTIP